MGETSQLQAVADAIAEGLSRGVSFIPGLGRPVGELLILPLEDVVAGSGTGNASLTLSNDVGFLWEEVAIDSTGEFSWVLKPSGFDFFTSDGSEVNGNVFQGGGTNQDNMTPIRLPVAWFLPGGTTMDARFTDISTNSNTISVALIGQKVRPGSRLEQDLIAGMAYAGMGGG